MESLDHSATAPPHQKISFNFFPDHRGSRFDRQRRPPPAFGAERGFCGQRKLHRDLARRRPRRRRHGRLRASRLQEEHHEGLAGESPVPEDVEPSRISESSSVRREAIGELLRLVVGGQQGLGRDDVRISRPAARNFAESPSADVATTATTAAAAFDQVGGVGGEVPVVDRHRFSRLVKVNKMPSS